MKDPDCFGNIDPNKNECVPNCKCFLECYNEMQRRARENVQEVSKDIDNIYQKVHIL